MAYVVIQLRRTTTAIRETNRLLRLITAKGIKVFSVNPEAEYPYLELTYDPTHNAAFLMVFGLDDEMLEKGKEGG